LASKSPSVFAFTEEQPGLKRYFLGIIKLKKCMVHIGPFKSGTTAFQSFLASNRDYFLNENIYIPAINKPGGHYDWLENETYKVDFDCLNYDRIIISSEIISSWDRLKILKLDNFFKLNSYEVNYVVVNRKISDSFLSMIKNNIRNNEEVHLFSDSFENFKSNPSYSVLALLKSFPEEIQGRLIILNYESDIIKNLLAICQQFFEIDTSNLKSRCIEIKDNVSFIDGREWIVYTIRNLKTYQALSSVIQEKIENEIFKVGFQSEILNFNLKVELIDTKN
jgi:hypothetical protein